MRKKKKRKKRKWDNQPQEQFKRLNFQNKILKMKKNLIICLKIFVSYHHEYSKPENPKKEKN